ncbi:hypothetical protein QO002_001042 [Pararhizobium capsulatum DSM 1112]|uniref:Glycosyl transferase family 2 n=1 Tax=Pararhizobium capsulatum DSM 1112 TaxID=1121113 RepID=A0ABU0BKY9_9HYPH|nr:hypothetical protein [Pararhizobium capsulatum]MDQ0318904.1 hypothetical protein [Pararhizobium capsulatum DSM 1112]
MTKLSICIPLETGAGDHAPLIDALLADPKANIEIVLAGPQAAVEKTDGRIKVVVTDASLSRQSLWHTAITAASGDWVTLVNPGDMIEPDLVQMVDYLERTSPHIDALAWTVLQIDRDAEPGKATSIAIPTRYHIDHFDKTAMLKAFFYWKGSLNVPKVPFGIHHAAIRRSVVDAILSVPAPQSWSTMVPQYEWAAKTLIFAEELAFCSRPLSVVNTSAYVAPSVFLQPSDFPFHAGLGLAGAVAEVQFHVLRELGTEWGGGGEDFVRACSIDCLLERDFESFRQKGNGYFAALQQFENGRLAAQFRPQFAERNPDQRRGLYDKALLIDRFVGGAQTAPEFYNVVKWMMPSVHVICDGMTQ